MEVSPMHREKGIAEPPRTFKGNNTGRKTSDEDLPVWAGYKTWQNEAFDMFAVFVWSLNNLLQQTSISPNSYFSTELTVTKTCVYNFSSDEIRVYNEIL